MPSLNHPGSFQQAPSSGADTGCLLLIVSVFLLLAFVWTWPASPWIVAGAVAPYLLCSRKARGVTAKVLREPNLPANLSTVRRRVIVASAAIGIIASIVCAASTDSIWIVQWCFFTALLWMLAAHLLVTHWTTVKKQRRLAYALSSNMREFFVIIALALGVVSAAALWIYKLPTNQTTLASLTLWEARVETVHRYLEAFKPSVPELLALLVALWVLRFIDLLHTGNTTAADNAGKWLKLGMRYLERVSLFVLVLASFTFLATGARGPVARISASIKEQNKEYNEFKRMVQRQVDREYRRQLLSRAWEQRPEFLQLEMNRMQELTNARAQMRDMQAQAKARFDITVDDPEARSPELPSVVVPPDSKPPEDVSAEEAPGDLNLDRIVVARSQATALEQAKDEEDETIADTLLKKMMDGRSPLDFLASGIEAIAALKESYPVVGELIGTVSSALNDATFQSLNQSAVRDIVRAKTTSMTASLYQMIQARVARDTDTAEFDWKPYSQKWFEITAPHISNSIAGVTRAEAELLSLAAKEQSAQIARRASEIETREAQLRRLAEALDDKSLRAKADSTASAVERIIALSRRWPPLGQPQATQSAELETIRADFLPAPAVKPVEPPMSYSDRLKTPIDLGQLKPGLAIPAQHSGPRFPLLQNISLPEAWSSPLTSLEALDTHCTEAIVTAVGQSKGSQTTLPKVREALGPQYDKMG